MGWPAFHSSSVHASPLLYDIDSDGVRDILVATYDGQIVFYKDTVGAVRIARPLLLRLDTCVVSPRENAKTYVASADARCTAPPARRVRRCMKASWSAGCACAR